MNPGKRRTALILLSGVVLAQVGLISWSVYVLTTGKTHFPDLHTALLCFNVVTGLINAYNIASIKT